MDNKNNSILQAYNSIFEKKDGKALNEEEFLDRLIKLESIGKIKLIRTLLESKSKQEVREYLKEQDNGELDRQRRIDIEKIIAKENIGK